MMTSLAASAAAVMTSSALIDGRTTIASTNETLAMLDQFLFAAGHSSKLEAVKGAIAGLALEAVLMGVIISQSWSYFATSLHADPPTYPILLTLFLLIIFTQFALTCWQTIGLLDTTYYVTALVKDTRANMTILIWALTSNGVAACYFCRRAWTLSGRKKWILWPSVIAITLNSCLGLATAGYGFSIPDPEDMAEADAVLRWYKITGHIARSWTILSAAIDLAVCACMIRMLFQHSSEFERGNKHLLRTMVILTTETMLPPVVLVTALFIMFELRGVNMMWYDRTLVWALTPIYVLSVLHSLVGREKIATALFTMEGEDQHRSTFIGIGPTNRFGTGSQGGMALTHFVRDDGSVHVAVDRDLSADIKSYEYERRPTPELGFSPRSIESDSPPDSSWSGAWGGSRSRRTRIATDEDAGRIRSRTVSDAMTNNSDRTLIGSPTLAIGSTLNATHSLRSPDSALLLRSNSDPYAVTRPQRSTARGMHYLESVKDRIESGE